MCSLLHYSPTCRVPGLSEEETRLAYMPCSEFTHCVFSVIPAFFSKCFQTIWLEICFKIWPRIYASITTMKLIFKIRTLTYISSAADICITRQPWATSMAQPHTLSMLRLASKIILKNLYERNRRSVLLVSCLLGRATGPT